MTYRDAAACVPTTRMLLTLIAAPQGGFAHDSALEEGVTSEPVSVRGSLVTG